MLHIVNKSPFERDAFGSCVGHAAEGSTILLIEDGVYAAITESRATERLATALAKGRVVALTADVDARGLAGKLAEGVEQVDYAGFVDLVTESERVQSWL